MLRISMVLMALACAVPAAAHDFWLQPRFYWLPPGGSTTVSIQVGHGALRQPSPLTLDRITMLRTIGPKGSLDQKLTLRPGAGAFNSPMAFQGPGTYIIALETNHASSVLPAIRFNDYLKFEGLTPALTLRAATRTTDAPGREIYSRRAKALVQVGPPSDKGEAWVTRPMGMSLEIVPEKNPYTLILNAPLPVRILYEGRPLAGALVMLTNLEFDGHALETHLSDASGRAAFHFPHTGTWLINVLWTKPIKGVAGADYDTTFSSLTFGYPPDVRYH
jgi:uncharacterized GH25 family protein